MSVLILTRHFLDENLGGPNCSKAFVKALCAIYPNATVIHPEHEDRTTDLTTFLGNGATFVPARDPRSALTKFIDVYKGRIHRFCDTFRRVLSEQTFDTIFIDHSFVAASGIIEMAKASGARVVTLHHNVERDFLRDNPPSALYRLPYVHYALRAERRAVLNSDINLVLTDADREEFASRFPEKAETFRVMGMFERADREAPLSAEQGPVFVISGSLAAAQTEGPVMAFLSHYLPHLLEICPDARLIITGRNPSQRLQELCCRHSMVELIPNPDDIESVIVRGNYYIAPINTGGGLKLRVMDGLRLGLPVIAHQLSSRGYEPIVADGHMYCYDDPLMFRRALTELLAAQPSHADVAASFRRHFSFESGKARLQEILQS